MVLTFDDEVLELGAELVVTGPGGAPVAVTGVVLDGAAVTWSLDPAVPAGAYTAAWRVTSADGHPVEGSLGWTAGAAGVPASPAAPPPADPSATSTAPEASPRTTADSGMVDASAEAPATVRPAGPPSPGRKACNSSFQTGRPR